MTTANLVIILCKPEEARNIGSTCRAMMNMGLGRLRIVGKRKDYNEEQVRTLALCAAKIWEEAEFFSALEYAVSDCVIAAGLTRRKGKKRKGVLLLPEEFAQKAGAVFAASSSSDKDTSAEPTGLVAAVFGNERSGLSAKELDLCTMGVIIPANPDFGSLNISHAVQIIVYEMYRLCEKQTQAKNKISTAYRPISIEGLKKTVENITGNLQKIGFFSLTGRQNMEAFWLSILSRAALSDTEADYLEKIFSKTAGLIRRKTDTVENLILQKMDTDKKL